jgi:hypothetical protein
MYKLNKLAKSDLVEIRKMTLGRNMKELTVTVP